MLTEPLFVDEAGHGHPVGPQPDRQQSSTGYRLPSTYCSPEEFSQYMGTTIATLYTSGYVDMPFMSDIVAIWVAVWGDWFPHADFSSMVHMATMHQACLRCGCSPSTTLLDQLCG